jgi:signal peptidase I
VNSLPELKGKLASLGLVPLARFLASLSTTGDLLITRDAWRARLCFQNGRLIAAVAPGEVGLTALEFVLLGMASGDFEFRAGRPSLEPDPELLDESRLWPRLERLAPAPSDVVPGPTVVPRLTGLSGEAEQAGVDLDRASLATLLGVDGRADVAGLAARLGGLRTLRGLVRLHAQGLLTFETPPPRAVAPPEAVAELPVGVGSRPRRRRVLRQLTSLPAVLGLLGLSLAVVPQAVLAVDGTSMTPALASGQLLLVNRAAYVLGAPGRGDVIVFRHEGPGFNDEYVVKRVIGMPGDLVQVDTGQVFVNGARLEEPYVVDPDDYTYPQNGGPLRVPEGAYFVLGDNRPFSADSHLGWFVTRQDLVGQAWPLPAALPAREPLNR